MNDVAIEFDRFRLLPGRRRLLADGVPVRIGGKAFDILVTLADAAGAVVSNRSILSEVWPDIHVGPAALRVHVSSLRAALAASGAQEATILNVPGRGYRLAGDVRRVPIDDRVEAAPAPTLRALPINAARVVGREELIANLCVSLPERQCVTIVGPGGVGKTTCALEVARRLIVRYRSVVFVDLGTISSSTLVGRAVALALGFTTEVDDPLPGIASILGNERNLVVLDSCEHVIEEAARFADAICLAAPGLDLLATSREPLRARKEWVHRLPPLRFPSASTQIGATEALRYPSVELFVERATASDDRFRLTDANAPQVAGICRRLDGMPLALELAASWTDVLPLRSLAERLEGHSMLHAEGRRGAPARHRTLRATIDWSFGLLQPGEQDLFRRLCVFAGDFSASAAEAVAGDQALSGEALLDALVGLARKSLVVMSARENEAEFHLLMAPRAYATEKLGAASETDRIRRKHLLWVLDELRASDARFATLTRGDWLQATRALLDDVRAAAAWAATDACDLEDALQLAFDSTPLWFRFSLTFEGRRFVEAIRDRFAGDAEQSPRQEVRLRTALGVLFAFTRAANAEVSSNWQRVLSLCRLVDDRECEMTARWGLWLVSGFTGDVRGRLHHAEAFDTLARVGDDPSDLATAHRLLTGARFALGDLPTAKTMAMELAEPRQPVGASSGAARFQFDTVSGALSLLAQIHWLEGCFTEARDMAARGVDVADRNGHGLSLASAMLAHASVAALLGDPDVALAAIDRYVAMPESQGLQSSEAVDAIRAIAWADLGRGDDAVAVLAKIVANIGDSRIVGRFPALVGRWSDILAQGRRADLGLALTADARVRFVKDSDDLMMPGLLCAESRLEAAAGGDLGACMARLSAAKTAARRQGALSWELQAAIDWVSICSEPDKPAARGELARVLSRFRSGSSIDLRRATRLLAVESGHPFSRSRAIAPRFSIEAGSRRPPPEPGSNHPK